MLLNLVLKSSDLDDFINYYQMYDIRKLRLQWALMIILAVLCLLFVCYIVFSNSRFRLKKNGYHTYIDLYKEIRSLNRKYKKGPVIVFVNNGYYRCKFKFTAGNRLVIIPVEKIAIETLEAKEELKISNDVSDKLIIKTKDNDQSIECNSRTSIAEALVKLSFTEAEIEDVFVWMETAQTNDEYPIEKDEEITIKIERAQEKGDVNV